MDDHQTTERVFEAIANALKTAEGPSPQMVEAFLKYALEYADACHNKKEEEHLFSLLERRGVPRDGGPLAVMLEEHEQSRRLLARLEPAARGCAQGNTQERRDFAAVFAQYSDLLRNHYWRENDILYPIAPSPAPRHASAAGKTNEASPTPRLRSDPTFKSAPASPTPRHRLEIS